MVVGGSGIVGSGIVGALLGSGAKCWVSSRSDAKFQELQKSLPASLLSQLEMRKVNLCNESETQQLREEILRKEGKLNNVVVSVGGWRTDGKLSTVSVDNYETALRDMTLPHFVCYKTFTKLLKTLTNVKNLYKTLTNINKLDKILKTRNKPLNFVD